MLGVVAQRVRAERMRLGMLQIDLAKKAGVNASTIYSLEAATNPTLLTLIRVAEALGVPVSRLLADDERGSKEAIASGDPLEQNLAMRVTQLESELGELKAMFAPGKRVRRRK
jgi:transcriptional regulator with XRE-family HTH domain